MSWKYVQRNTETGQYRTTDQGGGGGGSSTFAGLNDVNFSNLQNGQIPKYNSQTQTWENADESGGGGTVTDVEVNGTSVVNQQGVAEITIPAPPSVPVQDVEVDGVSVVNQQGVAEITMPTPPTIPVTDVKVNGTSVVDGNKEAQIKSYKEVTQAEYQALPSSKLTDNILYCIKDSAGADGFPPLIYSDEEREIGVWIDGKPLYEKSYIYENSSGSAGGSSGTTFDVWNLGNDKVIISDGLQCTFVNLATNKMYPLPYADSSFTNIFVDNGIVKLRVRNDDWGSNYKLYMIARYTKTTDTAGSGTWTTQGGYAHHYSATEHIIGTWFGKPLWEKTICYSSPGGTSDTNKIIDTSIRHGVNCNVVDVQGVQTYGYLDSNMPNNTSDPEPIAQSNLYLPYYAPSTSTNIIPAHIYFYSDGVHFMKRCATSEANGIILTVRYVKK